MQQGLHVFVKELIIRIDYGSRYRSVYLKVFIVSDRGLLSWSVAPACSCQSVLSILGNQQQDNV